MNIVSMTAMQEIISSGALSGLYTGVFCPRSLLFQLQWTLQRILANLPVALELEIFPCSMRIHVVHSMGVKSLFSSFGFRSFRTFVLFAPPCPGVSSLFVAPPAVARHA